MNPSRVPPPGDRTPWTPPGRSADLARRLEWATGLNGATLLRQIRGEGLDVIALEPEQVRR